MYPVQKFVKLFTYNLGVPRQKNLAGAGEAWCCAGEAWCFARLVASRTAPPLSI